MAIENQRHQRPEERIAALTTNLRLSRRAFLTGGLVAAGIYLLDSNRVEASRSGPTILRPPAPENPSIKFEKQTALGFQVINYSPNEKTGELTLELKGNLLEDLKQQPPKNGIPPALFDIFVQFPHDLEIYTVGLYNLESSYPVILGIQLGKISKELGVAATRPLLETEAARVRFLHMLWRDVYITDLELWDTRKRELPYKTNINNYTNSNPIGL